jgi:hypothetical protein
LAGWLGSVVAGPGALADGDGDVDVFGTGCCELGDSGSAGTAVCLLAVPLAITRAMTNALTSTTAAAAPIQSQRGAFGRPGFGSCGD